MLLKQHWSKSILPKNNTIHYTKYKVLKWLS